MKNAASGRSLVVLCVGAVVLSGTGLAVGWMLGTQHAEGQRQPESRGEERSSFVDDESAVESRRARRDESAGRTNTRERSRVGPRPTTGPTTEPDSTLDDRMDADVAEIEFETEPGEPVRLADLVVLPGERHRLPAGEVLVSGDLRVEGEVDASRTTLILDGADQTLEGKLAAKRIVVRDGLKRLRGNFSSVEREVADPGEAGLYVEAGTMLLIEEGGLWTTPGPYGFQIAGSLVIDGGEFRCSFTNGNGTSRGEDSWLPGSHLEIRAGKFVATGDADFRGASIVIHSGELLVNDDLWHTGDSLVMYGGLLRNATYGGMFTLTGSVRMAGGTMIVGQNARRGLRVVADALVDCTGGKVVIEGRRALTGDGGMKLASGVTFFDLVVNQSTRIHPESAAGAYLAVAGTLKIGKDQQLIANGRRIIAEYEQDEESGELVR